MIKELREKSKMNQKELAENLSVSDKTVSKWERGQGYTDIALLESIAKVFSISIAELISGVAVNNTNRAVNMMKSNFYVCSVCGNVIHSIGDVDVRCHGIKLEPELAEEADEGHKIQIEKIEDEYYVRIENEMRKKSLHLFYSCSIR
ncbi:helix-turn-helix transcriptional regulator [uncultured Peptoniphilus sp.]|uniref:helix-turn-helix transcriptional regulator n=1 Tax=uncultured Peptoniphilus sp. TaxID=254354 RepID=UPI0028051336|nr:helix-turn-helix transcriptional regulator [uncultured Peptoniphilus sp.]